MLAAVFLPKILQALDAFSQGWANHTISGEGKTPLRLWNDRFPLRNLRPTSVGDLTDEMPQLEDGNIPSLYGNTDEPIP